MNLQPVECTLASSDVVCALCALMRPAEECLVDLDGAPGAYYCATTDATSSHTSPGGLSCADLVRRAEKRRVEDLPITGGFYFMRYP